MDSWPPGWRKSTYRQRKLRDEQDQGQIGPNQFNLGRFVDAQSDGLYQLALAELQAGRKQSHWMWFIFPQHRDLGRSSTAKFYGLTGIEEARAYLMHPLLGNRLLACCKAILPHLKLHPAETILGPVDALKLRSSMEIFGEAAPDEPLFKQVLASIK